MPFKKFEIQPGNEPRGLMIKLYPTLEDERLLKILEDDTRKAWNWLVKQTEEVLQVREAYALRNNLVPSKPIKPVYEELSAKFSKEQREEHNKCLKETKEQYIKNCREWFNSVHLTTNKLTECSYRSFKHQLDHFRCEQDYQLLSKVINWSYEDSAERLIEPGSTML